jgi:undecaprenyl-diphosphatase
MDNWLVALLLGVIEGLTEFLPVSSTGHLLLSSYFLKFTAVPNNVFEVVIQFGAILAVCVVFWQRLWHTVTGLAKGERKAQRFTGVLILGFIPAMVLGALFHSQIKEALFNPVVIAWSLLIGGIVILIVERIPRTYQVYRVEDIPSRLAFKVGFCQALAMIPGVSRSGATIIGAMLLGVERKAAMEFSFFLAIPTMLAASSYDLYKNWDYLMGAKESFPLLAIGLAAAFFTALIVVRVAMRFIGKYGFMPFGWYRIVVGLVLLLVL